MVAKVIRDYIESGARKLTVPGFGTFMRRDGGEVVFVDLLRGDDPTLSELVEDAGHYSEVEAMAVIDRFIFQTKNAIERNGSVLLEGFGTMSRDSKGIYQFRYTPSHASSPVRQVVQETIDFEEPVVAAKPVPRPVTVARKKKKRRGDVVLVLAIIAAVIAVVVMFFALSADKLPFVK